MMRLFKKKVFNPLTLLFIFFVSCGVVEKLANRAPIIHKVSADRDTVFVGDTVTVTVDATDPDEDELTFSWSATGGIFISRQSQQVKWIAPKREDTFELQVIVRDENGGEAGESVNINVVSPSKPKIEITQPTDGQYIVGLGTIEIKAKVSPETFIDSVEFFINDQSLGVDQTPPYSFMWTVTGLSGWTEVKVVAYKSVPEAIQSADSIKVSIQGVVPIPK